MAINIKQAHNAMMAARHGAKGEAIRKLDKDLRDMSIGRPRAVPYIVEDTSKIVQIADLQKAANQ